VADNQHSIEAQGWPGGWYVYENGRVDGPYSAEAAFNLSGETMDGRPRLVSRKGFTQWYALKDLSEIFRMTEQLGRRATAMTEAHLATEIARSKELRHSVQAAPSDGIDYAAALGLTGQAARATPQRASTGIPLPAAAPAAAVSDVDDQGYVPEGFAPSPEAPVSAPAAPLPKRKVDKAVKGKKSASLAEPVSNPSPVELREADQAEADARRTRTPVIAGAAAATPATRESRTLTATKLTTPRKQAKAPRAVAPDMRKAVLHEYFLQRGRLRLGRLRNPFISGFVGLPLSLGVFWFTWFGELAREASFHSRGANASPLPPTVLALVPFVHIFMVYKLAQLVSEMETQNHYRSVSPRLAAVLAIFPPAALAYLQSAANKHWLLHVRHAVARKEAMPA
jgi:hypothetical protein